MAQNSKSIEEELKKRQQEYDNWIGTLAVHQLEAYAAAAEKVLPKHGGKYDYSALNNPEIQKKFADEMVAVYDKVAKELFGAEPKDEFSKELIRKVIGETKQSLLSYLSEYGEDYKSELHIQLMNQRLQELRNTLRPVLLEGIDLKSEEVARYLNMDRNKLALARREEVLSSILDKLRSDKMVERLERKYETNTKYKKAA